jgi:hypothetical protein
LIGKFQIFLARITRHLAFVIPAAAERRSPPESAGRGAFGDTIGEPTTDHAARYYKFESGLLQRRVVQTVGPSSAVGAGMLRKSQLSCGGTNSSNPSPSSGESGANLTFSGEYRKRDQGFESISLQQTVRLSPAATFERQEPGLSPQVCEARLTTGSAETQRAFHCAPTGGNVSAGPYSSTAARLMRSAAMPRSERNQEFPGFSVDSL